MKKLTIILLLSLFLFNTMGYFIMFEITQNEMREQAFEQIRNGSFNDPLTKITISKSQLSTIELEDDGNEIRFNGESFDIVKTSETKESVTYFCINDENESRLISNFENHINSNVSANAPLKNNHSKTLANTIIKLYFPNTLLMSLMGNSSANLYNDPIDFIYSSTSLEANSPPPKFA